MLSIRASAGGVWDGDPRGNRAVRGVCDSRDRRPRAALSRCGRHQPRRRENMRCTRETSRGFSDCSRVISRWSSSSTESSGSSASGGRATSIGEISITLGTPHPAGFRATEASRVFRIEPHDYHAVAAVAPEVGKHVWAPGEQSAQRAARPSEPRLRVGSISRDRPRPPVGRLLRRTAALPRPQPDPVQVAPARRAATTPRSGRGALPADGDYPAIRL